jgi:benzoate 4-monooxygenase
LAFDVIADYCFGRPFGFLSSGKDRENLVQTVDTRSEVLNTLGNLPKWMRPWMKYLRVDPFFYLGMRASANLVSFGVIGYNERMKSSPERKDLMSFLIKAKDPDNDGPLPSEEIISEAISFLVGGSDTVSTTINNIFDFVSRNQNLQQELFEELQEAFPGPLDDSWVAPEGVSRTLKLLDAFMKEGMRLRPTSSVGLERIVPAGGKEIKGKYFPAKCLVSVPTLGIHHNPEVFPVCKNDV